jgi:dTMP kinase
VAVHSVQAGRIVAFEGVDGAGKSTAIALVADALRERGVAVFMPRTGKDHASRSVRAIREITRDRRNLELDPQAELLLYCAREAQVLAELVKPALQRGELVLIDRSLLTAEVLGRARGLGPEACAQVARSAAAGLEPDLTIVFDVHPRTSRLRKQLAKIRAHSEERGGRKGLAGSAFKQRVRDGYGVIAAERGYPVLHCEHASPAELAQRALRLIDHGPHADLGESDLDRMPQWHVPASLAFEEALARLPSTSALLLGGGLIATRALRAGLWQDEPALCAYTLDAEDPLRAQLAIIEPAYALRGLAGKPLAGDGDLRVQLIERVPAACVAALKHVTGEQADALRRDAAEAHAGAVFASLADRHDTAARELRAQCVARTSDRELAIGLQQCDDEQAWSLRAALFERDPAYGVRSLKGLYSPRTDALLARYAASAPAAVLDASSGRDDPEAYRLRAELADLGHEVIDSVRGLTDGAAWALRERWVERFPGEVAHSLLGVPFDQRARELAERCARSGRGDLHVMRRVRALHEQDAEPAWLKARRQRASMEIDE